MISYTLENTETLSAFFKNRLIRLLPPMIFWSVIIYLTCMLLDNTNLLPQSYAFPNFLPSLTFISPGIWSIIFPGAYVDCLNPSFWALWVEVQFYLIAGLIFFMNKENFLRNILFTSLILSVLSYIPAHFSQPQTFHHLPPQMASAISCWQQINLLFSLGSSISYFTLGVVFHHLYSASRSGPSP